MKEEKRIEMWSTDKSLRELIIENSDWLLGGEDFEWKYFIEPGTNVLVLQRR